MGCTVKQRDRVRRAADACSELAGVVAADVLAPDTEPTGAWALECTIEGATAPPELLRELAIADLHVRDVSQRGAPTHTIVVATA